MKNHNNSLLPVSEVKSILDGIQDVIKVFAPDHTISFCNKAGYKFYRKNHNEIEGQRCYKLLNRTNICDKCSFKKVLENKQILKQERYIPELNRIMDICYTPILDNNGEVKFVVEMLRDVTEKRILNNVLKNDKERYEAILNNSPDALVIIVDNKIALANNEAENLFELDSKDLINSNIYRYFDEKHSKIMHKKLRQILLNKQLKDLYDCELQLNKKKISVQISCSYIIYEGSSAILMTIRNTNDMKKELIRASHIQKNSLQKQFPGQKYMKTTTLYIPAYIVSGDFYRIVKISDELLIGVLVDVKGKGISAALNISAFDLMFKEEVLNCYEPLDMIKNLNEKLFNYYEENYIAVSCFSIDFYKMEFRIVGAGINKFMIQKRDKDIEEAIAEGTFLGMFEDSEFSEVKFSIESGDKIILYTDGLDFVFDKYRMMSKYLRKSGAEKLIDYIDEYLDKLIFESGRLDDDCTIIALEII